MGWTDSFLGGSYLDSFLHPERGYEEAEKANRQGWEQAQKYQKPYWQQGLDQYGRLNDATGRLMDPAKLREEWAADYEQSPEAQRAQEINRQQAMEAANAMGLGGSSAALSNIQQGAGDISKQDRKAYLDDLMQKYMVGIGLGGNLYGIGANAGQNLGQGAQQFGQDQAQLGYGRVNAPGNLLGGFLGGAGKMAGQAAMNYMMPGSGYMMDAASAGGNKYNM